VNLTSCQELFPYVLTCVSLDVALLSLSLSLSLHLHNQLQTHTHTQTRLNTTRFTPNVVSRRPLVRVLKSRVSDSSSSGLVGTGGLRLDIERLFAKKLRIFGDVHMDRESLTSAILRLVLKTYFECVRLLKLSRNGYQQIFIDVHFLRLLMLRYVREMKTLESLADEIVKSARDRCVDLKEIDPSVVEAICKKKRASLNF